MRWRRVGLIAELKTPWIGLVGERWNDDTGRTLDYWRVLSAHSVVVIPRLGDDLLLLAPVFRPGVNRATLDFPGGRLSEGTAPCEAAEVILKRELGVPPSSVKSLTPVTGMPLLVNSSASNQMLHGFLAILDPTLDTGLLKPHRRHVSTDGARALLAELDCLQCRALLLEHLARHAAISPDD